MLPGGAGNVALGCSGGGGGLGSTLTTGFSRRGGLVGQLGEHGHGGGRRAAADGTTGQKL